MTSNLMHRLVRIALANLLFFLATIDVSIAKCPLSRHFLSTEIQLLPEPDLTPDSRGVYWALGSGVPSFGQGIDSGREDFCFWGYGSSDLGLGCRERNDFIKLEGDWAAFTVDGCIDAAGATPSLDGDECMAMAMSAWAGAGTWAAVMVERADPGRHPAVVFDFSRPSTPSLTLPMRLGLIPTPTVTRIRPMGTQAEVTATIRQGLFPGRGQYLEPACGDVLTGFELFKTTLQPPAKSVPSEDWRPGSTRWTRIAPPGPLGTEVTFTVDCGIGQETVVASAYTFRDGFETPSLSRPTSLIGTFNDADNDLLADACDTCTDSDRDGRGDAGFLANACPLDTCPNLSDSGEDVDGDGRGDVCDRCPGQRDPDPQTLYGDINALAMLGSFSAAGSGGRVVFLAALDGSAFELYSDAPGAGLPTKLNGPLVNGGEVFHFTLSPDGDRVAYWADQDTDDDIELYTVPVAGGPALRLGGHFISGEETVVSPLWFSPDGRWVVYNVDQEQRGDLNVYSVPIDGSRPPVRLNATEYAVNPLISPDSAHVVFTTRFGASFSVPIAGGPEVSLGVGFGRRALTPDGSKLLYTAWDPARGHIDLFAIPITGGAPMRISGPMQPLGDVESFVVAPDGSHVVYLADQETDGLREFYSATLSGNVVKLNAPMAPGTRSAGTVLEVRITSDSRTVVYVLDQDTLGVFELFAVPIEGGTPHKLSGTMPSTGDVGKGGIVFLSWSPLEITPDGKTAVYTADQLTDGQTELFSVPVAGGPVTRLNLPLPMFNGVRGFQIAPDGETVLFNAGLTLVPSSIYLYAASLSEPRVFRISETPLVPHALNQFLPNIFDVQRPTADGDRAIFRTGFGLFEASLDCLRPPNEPPVASAGPDQQAECSSFDGADILLDGSASTDADSAPGSNDDIVLFEWFEDFGLPTERMVGTGKLLAATLPIGVHHIILRVTDRAEARSVEDLLITVVDTAPPVISASAVPATLWPPNHRMVPVSVSMTVEDACGIPAVRLVTATSSEPDDSPAPGDGGTPDDVVDSSPGTHDLDVILRAERDGAGSGRIYSLIYRASDGSGNETERAVLVLVPHDRGGVTDPLQITLHETGDGTRVEWEAVTGAVFYDVARGRLSAVQETPSEILLGELTCIEAASRDSDTAGNEDQAVPNPGEAFFYLVQYHDGWLSSYGEPLARKPRVAPESTCREGR